MCLLALFDLDVVCAVGTAPYKSWKNPQELIIAILNFKISGSRKRHEKATRRVGSLAKPRAASGKTEQEW